MKVIQGSVDIYDKKKNEPLEFKTLPSASINQPKIFHVEQLMYYMAMLDVPIGQLIYQCILQFGNNPFVSFEITMNDEEREDQRKKLVREIGALQLAASSRDPSIARAVFSDKNMNWLCKDCPYVKSCENIERSTSMRTEKFPADAEINLKKLNHPDKLKVVVSANGDSETKYLMGKDLNSNTATVSFELDQKNDIVDVGDRDEYFVCAYALNPLTDQMESYSCAEGNIENTDGKNTISLGSGAEKTLSTGTFQTVSGGQIMDPTINVWIPLSDRKDAKDIKVVAMIKSEFQSKIIDAQKMLKQSDDNTLMVPLVFDKIPEIGAIQEGDMFYACVSANELNPPEGTECKHRKTSHTGHVHNLVAR